jgi:hypothetical protein
MARKLPVAETPVLPPAPEPEPTDAEQAEVQALAKRKKARRRAPRFTVHQPEGGPTQITLAGVHADAAAARVMNAFGTTSTDLADRLITQIITTTHIQPPGTPVSADTLNAALAAVTGIAPRDEAEAMLAAQMVAVHWLAMNTLRRATLDQPSFEIYDSLVNRATKLLRTFPAQLDALKRYRSAGEQRVVVQHQHVNVTADQAAVQVNGVAPDPGGRGAASKPEERSHEQRLGHASEPAMLCPEPARDAVPVAGCDGPGPLSASRRR